VFFESLTACCAAWAACNYHISKWSRTTKSRVQIWGDPDPSSFSTTS